MFIIYAVIIGILAGLITGGNVKELSNKSFRFQWLAICSFLIQIVLFSKLSFIANIPEEVIIALHFVSYLGILFFSFLNMKIAGISVIGLGVFLNAIVIFINGGYMPTPSHNLRAEAAALQRASGSIIDNNVAEMTENTLLPWLGDIFRLPSWLPLSNAFSIGDVLIAIGVFIYLIVNMRKRSQQ